MTTFRVGIDLASIPDVAASLARFGDRYLRRVYTVGEIVETGSDPRRLAARFAAKEAVIKVLAPSDEPIDLRDIEIRADTGGGCEARLVASAAALATAAGLSSVSVSVSHLGDLAAAVALGTFEREAVEVPR